MRYLSGLLVLLSLSSLLWTGCGEKATTPTPQKQGKLQVSLTDASAAYDVVNITFSEISAHIDTQWVTVRDQPKTVNLLEWNNGKTIEIGSAEVPAGHYTQIRIKIEKAEVIVDGQTYPLELSSEEKTGLKLGPEFTVNEGSTYELIVDFDANRSIVTTGPSDNPKGYKLKPRLRMIAKALTGSISGTVTNPEHLPVAYAIAGSDTVTSTPVDKSSGKFMLSFLPSGFYTVAISDTTDLSFLKDGLEVAVGANRELGTITLQ